jgi:hypothetical protein
VATQTEPTLTTLLIPFCLMALVNGASYPIVVAMHCCRFQRTPAKPRPCKTPCSLGLCFLGSLVVSAYISHPLEITVDVMLATAPVAVLGYLIQRRRATTERLATR